MKKLFYSLIVLILVLQGFVPSAFSRGFTGIDTTGSREGQYSGNVTDGNHGEPIFDGYYKPYSSINTETGEV